jgi:hypothetical protein
MKRILVSIVLIVSCVGTALAQSPPVGTAAVPSAPAIVTVPPAPSVPAVLRVGTEVAVRLLETLTSKDNQSRVGQRFRIEVAEDVKVDGRTVIPVGSTGIGEVTEVKNKGMWGQSGRLSARLLYIQVAGRQIRLSGSFNERGSTGTAGVVGAVVILPVAGFFVTGTSATFPTGTIVKGFIDEDVPLTFAAVAPSPLTVPDTTVAPSTNPK